MRTVTLFTVFLLAISVGGLIGCPPSFDALCSGPECGTLGEGGVMDAGPTPCETDRSAAPCQPVLVASLPYVERIAMDDQGALVTGQDHDAVFYVPLDRDAGVRRADPVPFTSHAPMGPSTDDAHLYWAEHLDAGYGRIVFAQRDGGAPSAIAAHEDLPYATVVDGAYIYWVSNNPATTGNYTVVRRAPTDGPADADTFALPPAKNQQGAHALTGDGSRIFWSPGNYVFAAPMSGGSPATVSVTARSAASSMAVVDNDIYLYMNGYLDAGGGIFHISKTADEDVLIPLVNHPPADSAAALAVDDKYVYYTDPNHGTVSRISRTPSAVPPGGFDDGADGGPEVLFTGQETPSGIAVDDKYIYWVNDDRTAASCARSSSHGADSVYPSCEPRRESRCILFMQSSDRVLGARQPSTQS